MSVVLDSSIALAWVLPAEATAAAWVVYQRVAERGAWVPDLWRLEVANALTMAARRRRVTAEFRDAALADLAALEIAMDRETSRHAWGATLPLADRFRLTVYDAAFLELALRRSLPLASLDRELRRAATALGIELLGATAD